MIKGVHQKPRANITHNYGNLETLSLKSELFPQYFHNSAEQQQGEQAVQHCCGNTRQCNKTKERKAKSLESH